MTALTRWADQLAAWALPEAILAQAPESPYRYPPELFAFRDEQARLDAAARHDPSADRARRALPDGGHVLDVGAGAGRASLVLVPPAARVTMVDQGAANLAEGARQGEAAGAAVDTVVGTWPDVAPDVPVADVAVCHHVLYNVADLAPFVDALTGHARRRVVVELTERHPWADTAALWRRFWDLDRPDGPTADDAAAAIGEVLGVAPRLERHERPAVQHPEELSVLLARRRLCLDADRDPEVADALRAHPPSTTRSLVTLSWDGAG